MSSSVGELLLGFTATVTNQLLLLLIPDDLTITTSDKEPGFNLFEERERSDAGKTKQVTNQPTISVINLCLWVILYCAARSIRMQ